MTIDVMISTLNDRILNVENVLLQPIDKVNYIICHQITNNKSYQISFGNRKDVKYIQLKNKGLSLNRNTCIKNASSDILLIADDDISYEKDSFEKIISYFLKYPNADILCFKTKITNSNLPFKKYPHEILKIDNVRKYAPASIEIAIKKKSLHKMNEFNTLFGVGSIFPVGEETIFIADAIENGCNIFFIPEYIVSHQKDSTGTNRFKNEDIIIAVGAYYTHIYGRGMAYLLCIRNALFNICKYKEKYSFFKYLKLLYKGISLYIIERRND